ncbi:MAG: hypothetical protein ACLGSD_15205 [Acidobacteriota bacterium]
MIMLRRYALVFAMAAFLLVPAAQAQLRNSDAFFGYSRLGSNAFYPNTGGLNGWDAAVHIHLAPFFGGEADVSHWGIGASAATPKTTSVMVGPRLTVKALGFSVFAHGLIGGEHSSNSGGGVSVSGGAFTYAIGGGLDVPLLPFFAWRVGGDRIDAPTSNPSGANHYRINMGLVFRF